MSRSNSDSRDVSALIGACFLGTIPACVYGCLISVLKPGMDSPIRFIVVVIGLVLMAMSLLPAWLCWRQYRNGTLTGTMLLTGLFTFSIGCCIRKSVLYPGHTFAWAVFLPLPFLYAVLCIRLLNRNKNKWYPNSFAYLAICMFLLPFSCRLLNEYLLFGRMESRSLGDHVLQLDHVFQLEDSILLASLLSFVLIRHIAIYCQQGMQDMTNNNQDSVHDPVRLC